MRGWSIWTCLRGRGFRGSIPPLLVRKRSSWTLISEHVLAAMLVSFVSQARLAWLWGTLTLWRKLFAVTFITPHLDKSLIDTHWWAWSAVLWKGCYPSVSELVQIYLRLSSVCENLNFPEKRVFRFHKIFQSVCHHPCPALLPLGWHRLRGKHCAH